MSVLGIPAETSSHPGIDRIGKGCRVASDVSVMRLAETPPGRMGIVLGDEVSLYQGVRLVVGDPGQHSDTGIALGNRVIVNACSYLSGEGGLVIDDEVLIGSHVHLLSAGHVIDNANHNVWRNPITYGGIRVCQGSWIGAAAVVLQGVTLGEGSVVGAGAVVTRDVPPFAVAVGNPARVHRFRSRLESHLQGHWLSRWFRRT